MAKERLKKCGWCEKLIRSPHIKCESEVLDGAPILQTDLRLNRVWYKYKGTAWRVSFLSSQKIKATLALHGIESLRKFDCKGKR